MECLEKFSKSRKPPVGFKPFVEQCIANGNTLEAKKYILKCENYQRPNLFLDIGAYREAAQAAFAIKDGAFIQRVRDQVQNSVIRQEMDELLYQLGLRED
jgi:hypothetical protein